jgi:probable rRNA maturation factor
VNLRLLRKIVAKFLKHLAQEGSFDIGIYLVAAPEIVRLNEAFLKHKGPTDVISFDYSEKRGAASRAPEPFPALLHGEVFVCVDEANAQSKEFRTSWQSELTRYIVHGILHLQGYDDLTAADRREMKREENRLLRQLSGEFELAKLALSRRVRTPKLPG